MDALRRMRSLRAAACGLLLLTCTGAVAQSESDPTRATAPGPEYRSGAPSTAQLWQPGDPGQRLHLRGRVIDTAGQPVAGAEIQLWQADGSGSYRDRRYRTQLISADNGEFRLATALPGQYYGTKHIHVIVTHPEYRPLTTRVLFKGDPHLSPADEDLAILLEEVHADGETVLVGGVQFVLEP